MNRPLGLSLLLWCLALLWTCAASQETNKQSFVRTIDDDIQYGVIHPFVEEWMHFFNGTDQIVPSPMHFWFRCVDREVRTYFVIESLTTVKHGKEMDMPTAGIVEERFIFRANGELFKLTRFWNGGGDLFFDLPAHLTDEDSVDVTVDGFQHFTRFQVKHCSPSAKSAPELPPAVSTGSNGGKAVVSQENRAQTQYIMHIHLREFHNATNLNVRAIHGVAKHMMYHRCALRLSKYEIVVQPKQVELFLRDEHIAHAAREGWLTFVVRNPVIPSPIEMRSSPHSSCYYQAYVENMQLLRYWKRNAKIYFFDSDEYLWISPNVTSSQFLDAVHAHDAVGFDRFMTFCKNCPYDRPELKHLSFSNTPYRLIFPKLDHPKLVVDPSSVGCYIVHWAGCGSPTQVMSTDIAYVSHFENLYSPRWHKNDPFLQNNKDFVPSKVNLLCDPSKYDWKSALPSFHHHNG